MSNTKNEIRGCIDIGSSYFRLLVVRGLFPSEDISSAASRSGSGVLRGSSPVVLGGGTEVFSQHESRRYLGWGDDLQKYGSIPGRRIDDAAAALKGLKDEAGSLGCRSLYIVATNTLRAAKNRKEIIEKFRESVKLPVSILTYMGEAALGLSGAAMLLESSGDILFADPGGTSTEVAWSRGGLIDGYLRYPHGTHSVRSMILRNLRGPSFPDQIRKLPGTTARGLKYRLGSYREGSDSTSVDHSFLPEGLESPTILFTGGTAISLAVVLGYMKRRSPGFTELAEVTKGDLGLISRRLAGLFSRGRQKSLPLAAERIELIVPGLILVQALMNCLGINSYRAVTRDLRWGVILSGGRMPGGYCVNE